MKQPWPIVKLGEVLTERRETPAPDELDSGSIRIVSKISFNTGRIELRADGETKTGMILARPGDLVISGINAAKGAVAIYGPENTEPIAATIHYGAYTPKPGKADLKFLWWFFRSNPFREILTEHVPGGIKTELKAKRLLPIPIPLPPLAEQRRIVTRIEELAAQIHEAQSLRQQAADETEALLVSYSRFQFSHPVGNSWRDLRIVDACDAMIDYRGRTPPISEEGIPHITSANIKGGRINWHTSKFVTDETYAVFMTRGIPQPQDVLFTMEAPLAEVGVVPDARKFSLAQRVILLRPKSSILIGDFLAHALSSPAVREDIFSKATATTVRGIASKRLKEVHVPVPSIPEQRRIVAELDALQAVADRLKALQAETAAELDALLPSILDRAFKGEL